MQTIYLVLLAAVLALVGYMFATDAISIGISGGAPSSNVNGGGGCQSCPQQH